MSCLSRMRGRHLQDTESGPLDSLLNIRIIKDDCRGLSAQLESHHLQVGTRRCLEDLTPNDCRSSECNFVYTRVFADGLANCLTEA